MYYSIAYLISITPDETAEPGRLQVRARSDRTRGRHRRRRPGQHRRGQGHALQGLKVRRSNCCCSRLLLRIRTLLTSLWLLLPSLLLLLLLLTLSLLSLLLLLLLAVAVVPLGVAAVPPATFPAVAVRAVVTNIFIQVPGVFLAQDHRGRERHGRVQAELQPEGLCHSRRLRRLRRRRRHRRRRIPRLRDHVSHTLFPIF